MAANNQIIRIRLHHVQRSGAGTDDPLVVFQIEHAEQATAPVHDVIRNTGEIG